MMYISSGLYSHLSCAPTRRAVLTAIVCVFARYVSIIINIIEQSSQSRCRTGAYIMWWDVFHIDDHIFMNDDDDNYACEAVCV